MDDESFYSADEALNVSGSDSDNSSNTHDTFDEGLEVNHDLPLDFHYFMSLGPAVAPSLESRADLRAELGAQELGDSSVHTALRKTEFSPSKMQVAQVFWLLTSAASPLAASVAGGRPGLPPLPQELAMRVLELAEYWPRHDTVRSDLQSCVDRSMLYLCSAPIEQRVRSIEVATHSRDQGWSSFGQHHGTYEASSSWMEVGLLRPPPAKDGASAAVQARIEDYVEVPGSRAHLQFNVHAGRQLKTHVHELVAEDFVAAREARPGDAVALYISARYPGWRTIIAAARISVYTSCF